MGDKDLFKITIGSLSYILTFFYIYVSYYGSYDYDYDAGACMSMSLAFAVLFISTTIENFKAKMIFGFAISVTTLSLISTVMFKDSTAFVVFIVYLILYILFSIGLFIAEKKENKRLAQIERKYQERERQKQKNDENRES